MYTTRSFQPKPIKLLLCMCLVSMLTMVSCGSDGDDDTSVEVQQAERQEGSASPGPTVIVNNNIDSDIRVLNKNFQVDNTQNALNLSFQVDRADNVLHQHGIYPSNSCGAIAGGEDSIVDRAGIEEELGGSVVVVNDGQGSSYQFNQSISLALLPPQENFIFVVFGAEEDLNIAVACFTFEVEIMDGTTDGTTGGGTTGGGTTGGGTTGGGTTGGSNTNACGIPNAEVQKIKSLFITFSDWASFRGTSSVTPENISGHFGQTFASMTQIAGDSWRFSGTITDDLRRPRFNYTTTFEIRDDGCIYSNGTKSSIVSASSNRLSIKTEFAEGTQEESYVKGFPADFDYNLKFISNGQVIRDRQFNLQRD